MDKIEYRSVIRFHVLEGKTASQTIENLQKTYGTSGPSTQTVYRWFKEYKRGSRAIEDAPRPGRPRDTITYENIHKVHQVILKNRRISVSEIAETTKISRSTVQRIIHNHLTMSKLSARWVPRMLTPQMKTVRQDVSTQLLERYRADPEKFKAQIITGYKT